MTKVTSGLGRIIRALRVSVGLDQVGLAKALGYSREYISLIEAGKRQPQEKNLKEIADYFDLPTELFSEDAMESEKYCRLLADRLAKNLMEKK